MHNWNNSHSHSLNSTRKDRKDHSLNQLNKPNQHCSVVVTLLALLSLNPKVHLILREKVEHVQPFPTPVHHLHLQLSLNDRGHWGTTDNLHLYILLYKQVQRFLPLSALIYIPSGWLGSKYQLAPATLAAVLWRGWVDESVMGFSCHGDN